MNFISKNHPRKSPSYFSFFDLNPKNLILRVRIFGEQRDAHRPLNKFPALRDEEPVAFGLLRRPQFLGYSFFSVCPENQDGGLLLIEATSFVDRCGCKLLDFPWALEVSRKPLKQPRLTWKRELFPKLLSPTCFFCSWTFFVQQFHRRSMVIQNRTSCPLNLHNACSTIAWGFSCPCHG